jgi:Chromate transporter
VKLRNTLDYRPRIFPTRKDVKNDLLDEPERLRGKGMATSSKPIGERETGEAPLERRNVAFTEAFRFWVKLGVISFGGPAGQIAIMHRERVERRRWGSVAKID